MPTSSSWGGTKPELVDRCADRKVYGNIPRCPTCRIGRLKVVYPRDAVTAKGLLLACIRDKNPCIFFEPKILYRSSVQQVPTGDFVLPLGKADVMQTGEHVTCVAWGSQVHVLVKACERAAADGISCEVIDLATVMPWDAETIMQSVTKTGRLLITHEAPLTAGFGAEIAAYVQQHAFDHLEAPITRVCGSDTPFPLAFEKLYLPDELKVYDAIKRTVEY